MHRFVIADVFTDQPFSGNQLGVFPEAQGLSERAMQAIARELNFAETTFVLPPARVRIFTPRAEMQFAGHPTVGTAAVLAHLRKLDLPARIVLEEGIGPVPVDLERRGALIYAQFTIEKPVELPSEQPEKSAAAAALSLPESEVVDAWFASGGVRFAFVRLTDKSAVDRAQLDRAAWTRHFKNAWCSQLYFFAGEDPVHARMFAPALGVEEDPATGSACAGLVGAMAAQSDFGGSTYRLSILQGVSMGRRSEIEAEARKSGSVVTSVSVGGATSYIASGEIEVPPSALVS